MFKAQNDNVQSAKWSCSKRMMIMFKAQNDHDQSAKW